MRAVEVGADMVDYLLNRVEWRVKLRGDQKAKRKRSAVKKRGV
jgi:hypothetical protein